MSDIFQDGDKMLDYFKERTDDIEKVVIFGPGMFFHSDGSRPDQRMDHYGMYICYLGGKNQRIGMAVSERVLNDGVLNRMKIRIEFAE